MHPVDVGDVNVNRYPLLATIAFAAEHRRKLALDYTPLGAIKSNGEPVVDRETGKPPVEGLREFVPYSLRMSKSGHLFLMGQNGREKMRAYRLDCITRAEVLNDEFEPQWEVEL